MRTHSRPVRFLTDEVFAGLPSADHIRKSCPGNGLPDLIKIDHAVLVRRPVDLTEARLQDDILVRMSDELNDLVEPTLIFTEIFIGHRNVRR